MCAVEVGADCNWDDLATRPGFAGKNLPLNNCQLRLQYREPPLTGPLAVTYRVYRQNNQHEADLGNYVNAIDDALQAAGVIANDRQIVSSQASKHLDAGLPRVEVVVHAIGEEAARRRPCSMA